MVDGSRTDHPGGVLMFCFWVVQVVNTNGNASNARSNEITSCVYHVRAYLNQRGHTRDALILSANDENVSGCLVD